MQNALPDEISREDVAAAISDFDAGATHGFAPSTGYDLLFNGRRYPPKAIVGLAARRIAGHTLTPYDFKGGEGSRCFRILRNLGFEVVPKIGAVGNVVPFIVGEQYTRNDIYEVLNVPEEKRRGNWETGYNRWGDDLFIFPTVGSAATGGYDYDNRWEGDLFVWYAKENTRLDQPQIQWMLHDAERVFVFTRPAVRNPFTFEGLATPESWEDESPVLIRWRVNRDVSGASFTTLPTEEPTADTYIEGATRQVTVNAYERNRKARNACVAHYGTVCAVCEFDFGGFYGEIGEGFTHVHHLRDLASIGEAYTVDPINDLRPVCPNCHAMLHTSKPPLSIEALCAIVNQRRASA